MKSRIERIAAAMAKLHAEGKTWAEIAVLFGYYDGPEALRACKRAGKWERSKLPLPARVDLWKLDAKSGYSLGEIALKHGTTVAVVSVAFKRYAFDYKAEKRMQTELRWAAAQAERKAARKAMPRKSLNPERDAEWLKLRSEGRTYLQIAAQFSVSRQRVHQVLGAVRQ